MRTEAEVFLPRVHILRKEPLSVSLSHYMGVRDQGLFNWPTDYSTYAFLLPSSYCRLSEAFLFSGLQVQRDQGPATRASFVCFIGLGNGDEFVHLPLRPQQRLNGALGETWAQVSLTAGEAYDSELISNSLTLLRICVCKAAGSTSLHKPSTMLKVGLSFLF